jgi:DNA-binding transcriptional regulator YdaS (Cro superfamily)
MELLQFVKPLSHADREDFAKRCETNLRQILNIAYGCKPCAPELAINIERESAGKVRVETLAPKSKKNKRIDWHYIRGTARPRKPEARVG